MFKFQEGVVGWTAVFVVFSVADNSCVASFYELVCDVFAAGGYSCGISGFETFGGRFRVIELYVNLFVKRHPKRKYCFANEAFTQEFFYFSLPASLFRIISSRSARFKRIITLADEYC